jgi:cell division protease FtsH
MTTMPPPPPPPPSGMPGPPLVTVHEPDPDDREDKVRRKVVTWDRVKVLVLLSTLFAFLTASKHSSIPIMTWGDAIRDQLRAKWWMLAVAGLEVLRQIHYVISERSEGWHRFWQKKLFGGWDRTLSKMSPWNRFRLQRFTKRVIVLTLVSLYFGSKWKVSAPEALVGLPGHFERTFFSPARGNLPIFWTLIVSLSISVIYMIFFFGIFFFDSSMETYKPGEIKTRFSDVWGQDPVLTRVKETVAFLDKPQEIEARGGYVPGGILLWGPPGTGKTLMAEAMAGETDRPYVNVDPSAFIQTFMGVAPMKVRYLYSKLRKLALRHGGVVVFFDEADSLGSRGSLGNPGQQQSSTSWSAAHACNGAHYLSDDAVGFLWNEHVAAHPDRTRKAPRSAGIDRIIMGGMGMGGGGGALQALLTQMSGLKKPRGFISRRMRSFLGIKPRQPPKYRILHVFATNQPNALDQALLRPGRIDRQFHVGYPHADGRRRTFEGYLNKIKHEIQPTQLDRLSVITPYYTGARIKDIVNESVVVAMREDRDIVTWTDLLKAKYHKGHGEAEDMKFTALERHQVAIHEASHAVATFVLHKRAIIDVATIEPRSDFLGMVQRIALEERFTSWRSEREIDVMISLASVAGERMMFDGDNSTGVSADLNNATSIVLGGMARFGMGPNVASRNVSVASLTGYTDRPEDGTDRAIFDTPFGQAAETKLKELLEQVRVLLADNLRFVFAVAHALETHKTITGEDVEAIFRGTPGPEVDGWMYHTDDFLISYEAYHLSLLDAHRRQLRTDPAVPMLVGAGRATNGNGNGNGGHPPMRAQWAPPRGY